MNYTKLSKTRKEAILKELLSGKNQTEVSKILGVSRTTVRNVINKNYKKHKINGKYDEFINYIENNLDSKTNGVEVCIFKFKKK